MVASSAYRRIDFAVSRRRLLLCLRRRGPWYSPRHGRIHDGPVWLARNPSAVGHDASFRNDDPDGKHAGLAAVRYEGDQPDPALCLVRPECALSRRRFFHCLAGDFGHGSSGECLCWLRFAPLPQRDLWRLNEQEKASMRLNYAAIAPEATKALAGVNAALLRAGLDKRLMDVVFLRVSQINGCAYCVDLHARDLRLAGESNERLDGLAGWRESPYFTEPEKAALEWAEALTHVEVTHAPDAAYEPLARHYNDKQVANITYAIALMNAWNRVAIGFHDGPEPNTLQSKAGYIDARSLAANRTKPSCNARPDHTSGSNSEMAGRQT